MKTPLRHLALLILLALAFAGAPGHATATAAMDGMTDCVTHGANPKCDCKAHTATRCITDCTATPLTCAPPSTAPWQPDAAQLLIVADRPHAGWLLPPQTPPPRLPS